MSDTPPAQPPPDPAPVPALPLPLDYHSATTAAPRPVMPWLYRFAYFVAGALLPVVCFTLAADETPLSPDWQSGRWDDKVALLLETDVGWPFLPLLAYAVTCMVLLVYSPLKFARRFPLRLGIYGGVLLALHYSLVFAAAAMESSDDVTQWLTVIAYLAGAAAAPVGLLMLLNWLGRRFGVRRVVLVLVALALAALLVGVIATGPAALVAPLGGAVIVGLVGAVPFALASYVCMALFVRRHATPPAAPSNTAHAASGVAWLGGYGVAWGMAVRNAINEYAALPLTKPSGCYVCTAAARGHRRLVGSETVVLTDGTPFTVNRQMRRLKCAEVALRTLTPMFHRACRAVYDRLGPPMARAIRVHPLLADLAYLALLPAEWLTSAALRLLVSNVGDVASTLWPHNSGSLSPVRRGEGGGGAIECRMMIDE
jgi:hypothetical protein